MPKFIRPFIVLTAVAASAACSGLGGATPEPTVFVPIIGSGQPTQPNTATEIAASEVAPAEWASLGLSGRLRYTLGRDGLQELDLATGETRPVFTMPDNTWLTSAATAPDDSAVALAYAPPPPEGMAQLGYTSIYTLPGDCGQRPDGCSGDDLTPFISPAGEHEAYFSPTYAPDGRAMYFAHFTPSQNSNTPYKYTLEQMPLPSGSHTVLVENAIWPALTPDGGQLVYVWFDPVDYSNDLFIAEPDGTNARVLVDPALFEAVDAPFFSPDGEYVYFSAVGEGQPGATPAAPAAAWLDRLLGVRVAQAAPDRHNVPSDWWRVPAAGGTPERLTHTFDTGLFGDFSPDGEWIGFASATGLYVMRPDGSVLTRLNRTSGAGTLEWLP